MNASSSTRCNPQRRQPSRLCEWGNAPYSCAFARLQVRPFLDIFARRPYPKDWLREDTGLVSGFLLWCIVRALAPAHIIESGFRHGLGTWLLRQAAPTAQLILLDPYPPSKYVDDHADTRYIFGNPIFQDFNEIDWDCLNLDKERTLVFFDDHQAHYRRLLEAFARGFRHVYLDDNYPPTHAAEFFSAKIACDANWGGTTERRRFGNGMGPPGRVDWW